MFFFFFGGARDRMTEVAHRSATCTQCGATGMCIVLVVSLDSGPLRLKFSYADIMNAHFPGRRYSV